MWLYSPKSVNFVFNVLKPLMKSKNYVHLVSVGEIETKMIRDLLLSEKIPSELHPSAVADALAGQAVHGSLSYDIRVPKEMLDKAKEVLNIN